MTTTTAPLADPRFTRQLSLPQPGPRDLARAALGPVSGLEVLVAGADARLLARSLEQDGARVTILALGDEPAERLTALDLPTWTFDALLAEGLLASSSELEAVLYRLRAWVRPDAPFALLEPLAPIAWDASDPPHRRALTLRDLETVRHHLPGVAVTRLPAAERPAGALSWANTIRSAVESVAPWLPGLTRDVRVGLLAGRLPP
jgi:hypothetical protein